MGNPLMAHRALSLVVAEPVSVDEGISGRMLPKTLSLRDPSTTQIPPTTPPHYPTGRRLPYIVAFQPWPHQPKSTTCTSAFERWYSHSIDPTTTFLLSCFEDRASGKKSCVSTCTGNEGPADANAFACRLPGRRSFDDKIMSCRTLSETFTASTCMSSHRPLQRLYTFYLTLADDRQRVEDAVPEHCSVVCLFHDKVSEIRQPIDEFSALRRFCMRTVALQLHRPISTSNAARTSLSRWRSLFNKSLINLKRFFYSHFACSSKCNPTFTDALWRGKTPMHDGVFQPDIINLAMREWLQRALCTDNT
ncbi:hypothetical protein KC361_g295 [Hortaea werneckii]|nr:hypothetical protein KC361_g295 [Hortaea werneckii]